MYRNSCFESPDLQTHAFPFRGAVYGPFCVSGAPSRSNRAFLPTAVPAVLHASSSEDTNPHTDGGGDSATVSPGWEIAGSSGFCGETLAARPVQAALNRLLCSIPRRPAKRRLLSAFCTADLRALCAATAPFSFLVFALFESHSNASQFPQAHSANDASGILLPSTLRRVVGIIRAARTGRCFAGCSARLRFSRSRRCARKSRNRTAIADIFKRSATSCVEYCRTSRNRQTCRSSGASWAIASAINLRISLRAKRSAAFLVIRSAPRYNPDA